MDKKYILVLDQGTTSSRALLIDRNIRITGIAQREFTQHYPRPGWVEHDPSEIWQSQLEVIREVIKKSGIDAGEIAAMGITNQRETTVVWNRKTGKPVYNAIVWQDRRTSAFCDDLKAQGMLEKIRRKTGLLLDSYFSATKINWILKNIPEAAETAKKGELAFGTIDTWLIWNLTGGKIHATDASNASRTLLYNIVDMQWDDELLDIFGVDVSLLPDVKNSSEIIAETDPSLLGTAIPVAGVAGDQQAALFGQLCTEKGMIKNTYGTGCFMMMNTGDEITYSKNNLLSTVAWMLDGKPTYALEGSVFIGGAVIQWLRDGLGLIENAAESEAMAKSVEDNGGIYLVPAFTGLGAPHWDQYARGTIVGITRGTTAEHFVRAALEGIAYQNKDVLDAMLADSGNSARELRVDGGATANNWLMQFQADILNLRVNRPEILETTALGAGFFAGLATGFWPDIKSISEKKGEGTTFKPGGEPEKIREWLAAWNEAVDRSKAWSNRY
jgi:glycerol kinase